MTTTSKSAPTNKSNHNGDGDTDNDDEVIDKNIHEVYGNCVSVGKRYEKLGRLGQGTYGIVYKARDRQTNSFVALKRCIPHHEASDGFPVTTLREIQSLRLCAGQNEHVVQLQEIAVSRNGVFLVFEYCQHDMANLIDAHYQIHRRSPFDLAAVKTLLQQLLSALDTIHSNYIIHRDVKLTNLLYNNQGQLKLADFGLSRPFSLHDDDDNRHLTPNVASLWYRPPELLLGVKTYTTAMDIWATGCLLAEFLSGQPLLNGKTETEQIELMVDCLGVPTERDWPQLSQMPKIRHGVVQLATLRKSRRTALDTFGELSPAGLALQSRLLHYDAGQRWTARQCLDATRFFVESPLPLSTTKMPRFSSSCTTTSQ